MTTTDIEWTARRLPDGRIVKGDNWNTINGCTNVSEGCRECYARLMAARFSKPGLPYEGIAYMENGKAHWTGNVQFLDDKLLHPFRKRRPTRFFVNSMSDTFHQGVSSIWIDRMLAVIAMLPQHQFLLLTKRPENAKTYMNHERRREAIEDAMHYVAQRIDRPLCDVPWPLPNLWLGTSVELDRHRDRIDHLRKTTAAVRFISAEPLLGPLDVQGQLATVCSSCYGRCVDSFGQLCAVCDNGWLRDRIHWLITGGESGPRSRPMDPEWPRALLHASHQQGVKFFMKQMGTIWMKSAEGRRSKGSKVIDIPQDLQVREWPDD